LYGNFDGKLFPRTLSIEQLFDTIGDPIGSRSLWRDPLIADREAGKHEKEKKKRRKENTGGKCPRAPYTDRIESHASHARHPHLFHA
jgi:hypothetical protein